MEIVVEIVCGTYLDGLVHEEQSQQTNWKPVEQSGTIGAWTTMEDDVTHGTTCAKNFDYMNLYKSVSYLVISLIVLHSENTGFCKFAFVFCLQHVLIYCITYLYIV